MGHNGTWMEKPVTRSDLEVDGMWMAADDLPLAGLAEVSACIVRPPDAAGCLSIP